MRPRGWRVLPASMRSAVVLVAAVAMLVLGGGVASAHAYLQSSAPAQGSVLKASPPQVLLHFSEQVGTSLSDIEVLTADGHNVATGSVLHPFNVSTDLAVLLQPRLADGTYLVVWRVVADDSHPTGGSFSFSVGKAGAVATADASASPDPTVGALLGFGRLLGFIGIAAFFGGVAFLLWCWRAGWRSTAARRTLQVGWLLAFVGAAAAFLLEGPYGAGRSLSHTFDTSLIRGVTETRYGTALLARVVLLALAGRRRLAGCAEAGSLAGRGVRRPGVGDAGDVPVHRSSLCWHRRPGGRGQRCPAPECDVRVVRRPPDARRGRAARRGRGHGTGRGCAVLAGGDGVGRRAGDDRCLPGLARGRHRRLAHLDTLRTSAADQDGDRGDRAAGRRAVPSMGREQRRGQGAERTATRPVRLGRDGDGRRGAGCDVVAGLGCACAQRLPAVERATPGRGTRTPCCFRGSQRYQGDRRPGRHHRRGGASRWTWRPWP